MQVPTLVIHLSYQYQSFSCSLQLATIEVKRRGQTQPLLLHKEAALPTVKNTSLKFHDSRSPRIDIFSPDEERRCLFARDLVDIPGTARQTEQSRHAVSS